MVPTTLVTDLVTDTSKNTIHCFRRKIHKLTWGEKTKNLQLKIQRKNLYKSKIRNQTASVCNLIPKNLV